MNSRGITPPPILTSRTKPRPAPPRRRPAAPPGPRRLAQPLLAGLDELAGDHAAHDLVFEDEALARLGRHHVDDHVAVLARATRLAHELALDLLHPLADRLAVGHLRPAHVGLHLELAEHAVHQDLQVELAHPGDDGLPG